MTSNADVVLAAVAGRTMDRRHMNMWTQHFDYPSQWIGGSGSSWLSPRLSNILSERKGTGHVDQVILSYNTPIAWRDSGKWIVPDATYSITTSSKHMSQLYHLPSYNRIPEDAGMEEYLAVLDERIRYTPRYGKRLGTYEKV